ncbi:hypothetical protein PVAND_010559 [Polypedilum vanderplanki]|uniref:protein acetyllysine N-acetyltransferase n=1 Tax=Polypedilum vanderplanki TaxID=319348 RepID=A0A9J6CGL8_POLVA|nr:hypothetical protein PVAND_010559 [Polypedilum vanderplanki]
MEEFFSTRLTRKKEVQECPIAKKREKAFKKRKISAILKKSETSRTSEETRYIEEHLEIVKEVSERKKRVEKYKDRALEKEDKPDIIEEKAKKLASVIKNAKHLIVYSGAGISTSAKIPDYRGPQGIWTLLQRGEEIGHHDLSLAEPTYTHMSLYELHKRKILKYVVSQNCDGLHLRSGLPRFSLSEVHGNMYIEVCKHCKPALEYWRIFDTTPLTSRFQHKTNRRCRYCANPLIDTIVHFGERGSLKWPLNWNGATKNVEKADVILCLGSSLKVLKKYPWLWALDKPQKQRPKIYIVNLQWTPKDSIASIKINGRCDEVMKTVMKHLNIEVPKYDRENDPIFHHASLLKEEELHTASQPMLKRFVIKDEDDQNFNENDESTNSITMSSDKQTESEDHSQSTESAENFINKIKSDLSNDQSNEIQTNSEQNDNKMTEIKLKLETPKKENNAKEIFDLTVDECDDQKNNVCETKNEVIDFEELIDNLDSKVVNNENKEPSSQIIICEEKEDKENQQIIVKSETDEQRSKVADIIMQQNQNLIDMALLNNSLLTASLAFAPAGTTSKEALTATALILNYNNQIISTLTNNLNMLPYTTNTSVANGSIQTNNNSSSSAHVRSICDKNNVIKSENFENDIEMVEDEASDDDNTDEESSNSVFNKCIDEDTSSSSNLNPEQYYKQLFANYCKAINDNLPQWSDVNYAYSGLHTIVNPEPENANLWRNNSDDENQKAKKLRSSTAAERKAAKAECKFCYDKYEMMECQFYKPINREFKITTYRNGKTIVCECCDYTEEEEDEVEAEQNNDDDDINISKSISDEKDREKSSNNIRTKAGWFGKGYRKIQKKRKKVNVSA